MWKKKPRGKRERGGELRNCEVPSSFTHPIRAPADVEQSDGCARERNRADPANQVHISPAGEPLQDRRKPKPKCIATDVSEK